MKTFSRLLFALLLVFTLNNTNAQDKNNPWQFSFGVNAVDFFPNGDGAPFGDQLFDEFFNLNEHFNVLPTLSTVTISRYLTDNFSVGITGSYNQIEDFGDQRVDDLTYIAADLIIKYDFNELLNIGRFHPHLGIGGGYTWLDQPAAGPELSGNGTLNFSGGLSYYFSNAFGITVQSTYKENFDQDNIPAHFQHSVSLAYKFGGKDSDGDGIYDNYDECPDVPGLEAFNGCPDSDGDGIKDSEDDCPNIAGLAEFNGCPDSDGDGIQDNKDNCPNEAGLASLNGCPDADGDGIANGSDNCPNEAGPSANNGCPWPDSDGDGVLDKDDQCPNEVGTVANNGCPEVVIPTPEVENRLTNYARDIKFNSSRSSFRDDAFPILQAITAILKEYPKANFRIEGHTDSTGSPAGNQKLSESRANAVLNYLVDNGISSSRLTAQGFGQSSPIETNDTRAGRAANRRVEVKLVK